MLISLIAIGSSSIDNEIVPITSTDDIGSWTCQTANIKLQDEHLKLVMKKKIEMRISSEVYNDVWGDAYMHWLTLSNQKREFPNVAGSCQLFQQCKHRQGQTFCFSFK